MTTMMPLLQCFLFLIPFQWALSPVAGIDLPVIRVFSLGIIGVWFWNGLLQKRLFVVWNIQSGFLFSFWFLVGISMVYAPQENWAFRKLLFLFSFLPLSLVFVDVISQDRRRAMVLVKSLVLGATGSALVGILQFMSQFVVPLESLFSWWTGSLLPLFLGDTFARVVAEYPSLLVNLSGKTVLRASALFPDPHMHAFFLGLVLPLACWIAWYKRTILWGVVAVLIGVADILTFSRGAYLGMALAVLVGVVLFVPTMEARAKKNVFLIVFLLGIVVMVPNPIAYRFQSGFSSDDGSVATRVVLFQEALTHIRENPWLGVGLGNYPLTVKPDALEREPIYVHNLWLDIAVEMGLIAAVFFAGYFLRSLWVLYAQWQRKRDGFSLALFFSLVLFLGHSMVDTPIFSVHVLPVLLLVLAIGTIPYET